MAENAQTMTEFTYAPGEKNIVGDRFSPSVIIFWLKTSIAASSTRVQYKAPNTLFGLIPLGASTKTIPLRNIASVDTNTKFNLGSLVWGLLFLFVGFGMFNSNALAAIVFLIIAAANFANVMSATLTFHDPSGGANAITVSILEKDRLIVRPENNPAHDAIKLSATVFPSSAVSAVGLLSIKPAISDRKSVV